MAAPFMLPSSVQQAAGARPVVQKVHTDCSFQNVEVADMQLNDLEEK